MSSKVARLAVAALLVLAVIGGATGIVSAEDAAEFEGSGSGSTDGGSGSGGGCHDDLGGSGGGGSDAGDESDGDATCPD